MQGQSMGSQSTASQSTVSQSTANQQGISPKQATRNRKRSQRRRIFCPTHGGYLESTSRKYRLYADKAETLQERGMPRRTALLVVASYTAVPLTGEWLERFWCDDCGANHWYHVKEVAPRQYELRRAPQELWEQVEGVIHPNGNPSVGEFTRRQSRMMNFRGLKDFGAIG